MSKKLKMSIKNKHARVLVVTGNAGNEKRLVKRLKATDLLEKPLDCTPLCTIFSLHTMGTHV